MWGILACILPSVFHISTAFSSFTYSDKYLKAKQLRVIQVKDWYECIKQCQEEPLCISYNYDYKSHECQINEHGVEERCQAEDQLTSRAGWIYHQIREVKKKKGRDTKQGSCPCNCGVDKQCRVEPEYGDVPEKAGSSCRDILERRGGSLPNRAYYITGITKPVHVYCQMTSIPGCDDEGGWTLVMKINGSKSTFHYESDYWTTRKEYQPENGANLDEKETKLMTFSNIIVGKICFGMKAFDSSSIQWLSKERRSSPEYMTRIFENGQNAPFRYDKHEWQNLLLGSTLDSGKKVDGFNAQPSSGDGARVRIGVIAYPSSKNDVPISYIGFGAGGSASAMHMGLTCGNVNGQRNIPAFGYILLK